MCGAVAVKDVRKVVRDNLRPTVVNLDDFTPNNNIRPTNPILGLRPEGNDLLASMYMWGYLPRSAKSKSFISEWTSFNATCERAPTGKLYSDAFKKRRMILVGSAWFEWPKWNGPNKPGVAQTILPTNEDLFVFAGLWVAWKDPETNLWHDTATMMTTEPTEDFREIHRRMPAVLTGGSWKKWIDPATSVEEAQALLQPCPTEHYEVQAGGPAQFAIS
jgi:putative SOS response-associated peptidase YedK